MSKQKIIVMRLKTQDKVIANTWNPCKCNKDPEKSLRENPLIKNYKIIEVEI
jgi:hypothetical protein